MGNRQLNIFDDDSIQLFWKISDTFPNYESYDLEYKSAVGGFPKDFWKTYSAFANTQGGFIVLGVREKKGGCWLMLTRNFFRIAGFWKDIPWKTWIQIL